jgi:hypothetical protein
MCETKHFQRNSRSVRAGNWFRPGREFEPGAGNIITGEFRIAPSEGPGPNAVTDWRGLAPLLPLPALDMEQLIRSLRRFCDVVGSLAGQLDQAVGPGHPRTSVALDAFLDREPRALLSPIDFGPVPARGPVGHSE